VFIDDKAFQVLKKAQVNGKTCALLYHPRLKVSFVCQDDEVVYIGQRTLAPYEYDSVVKSCLEQIYQENIVEGSLA